MSINLGLCITGSFCTFEKILILAKNLVMQDYKVTPILSFNAAQMDTKFFKAKDFADKIQLICGVAPFTTIQEAEPVGTKKLFDICLVAPATGNSLAKINNGITDTPVTMCVKAHLRNNRPVVLFVSTNDGLSASARNIGGLINKKHMFFVPFSQDNPTQKPNSLVSKFELVIPTLEEAIVEKQIQPVLR
ncbi:MAG: dipicolinate synthase subunit B [Clostridia bacterium]